VRHILFSDWCSGSIWPKADFAEDRLLSSFWKVETPLCWDDCVSGVHSACLAPLTSLRDFRPFLGWPDVCSFRACNGASVSRLLEASMARIWLMPLKDSRLIPAQYAIDVAGLARMLASGLPGEKESAIKHEEATCSPCHRARLIYHLIGIGCQSC
jgi:hypothetical protein